MTVRPKRTSTTYPTQIRKFVASNINLADFAKSNSNFTDDQLALDVIMALQLRFSA